jgi:hypothetical protein
VILILLIVYVVMLINKKSNLESFVQVKSDTPKNPSRPASLRRAYIPQTRSYERDDPISNPKYSPNIVPNLPEPSNKLNYPANSKSTFEHDGTKKVNNPVRVPNSNLTTRPEANYLSGQKIDSAPTTIPNKPYVSDESPQPYSEYLQYSNPNKPEPSDYELEVLMEQNKNIPLHHSDNLYLPNKTNEQLVKKLLKKSAQLSVESTQDSDPIVSVQKANYAIGYLDAIRDIMPEQEIVSLTGVDMVKFTTELNRIQSNNLTNLSNKCAGVSSDNKYLLKIATQL